MINFAVFWISLAGTKLYVPTSFGLFPKAESGLQTTQF